MPERPARGEGKEASAASDPLPVEDQLVEDWASAGIRRLERHLATHARFCDYLLTRELPPQRRNAEDGDDR